MTGYDVLLDGKNQLVYSDIGGNKKFNESAIGFTTSFEDGVTIPKYARGDFNGRSVVHLEDPEFTMALKFVTRTKSEFQNFRWVEDAKELPANIKVM